MKILRSAVGSLVSLGLIKELQKYGVEVIGMDTNVNTFGRFYLDKCHIIPPPNSKNFIPTFLRIIKQEKPDAILSGPNAEIYELMLNRDIIEKTGTKLIHPNFYPVSVCVDKVKTHRYFEGAKIPYPEIFQLWEDLEFPLFMKPRFGSGSHGAYKIDSYADLVCILKKPFNESVLQEYIFGTEYSIDTLGDKEGNLICCVPRKRIKTSNGLSIISQTKNKPNITKYCKQIVKELKLFGPSCIQCIETYNGELKFLEINNRFGGGAILSIKACPDFIPILLKMINGEPFAHTYTFPFKSGLTMYRNYTEVFTDDV